MRKPLALACFLSCMAATPALADGLPPFQLTYQPGEVVAYPEATTSSSKITLINRSGEHASDVVVSLPGQGPGGNYTFVVGSLPDGYDTTFLKTVLVPDGLAGASTSEAGVLWHVEYTNAAGNHTSVDLTAEPAPVKEDSE